MKKLTIIPILTVQGMLSFAQKATDDFSGRWKTPEGKIIAISKIGNSFQGFSEEKKMVVLKSIVFTDKKWKGFIIQPTDASKFNCELILNGSKLTVTAKKGIFSKNIIWVKI